MFQPDPAASIASTSSTSSARAANVAFGAAALALGRQVISPGPYAAQPVVQPTRAHHAHSEPVRIMRSGCVGLDPLGNRINCFLHVSEADVPIAHTVEALVRAGPPQGPWRSARTGHPGANLWQSLDPAMTKIYDNSEAYFASPECSAARRAPTAKVVQRKDPVAKQQARSRGLVRSAESFEQVETPGGEHEYEVHTHPHYVTQLLSMPIASTTRRPLPTHRYAICSFVRGHREPSPCVDVAELPVWVPETKAVVLAGSVGHIESRRFVDCYAVGTKYWLFRAGPPTGGVVTAHAVRCGRFELREGLRLEFDSPDRTVLGTMHPLFQQDLSPASSHQTDDYDRHEIKVFSPMAAGAGDDEILRRHAGTDTPRFVSDLELQKASMPAPGEVDEAEARYLEHSDALHNPKEMAAVHALESGEDVILVRKGARNEASLSNLIQELDECGLLPEGYRLRVNACRASTNSGTEPVYGIAVNLPKGSDPVATVVL